MNRTLALLLPLLMLAAGAQAQNAFRIGGNAHDAAPENYRAPLQALRNMPLQPEDKQAGSLYHQAMTTYQSFAGNYDSTLYYSGKGMERMKDRGTDSAFYYNYSFRPAKDALLRKADQQQVLMLNEAHHVPAHRAFAIGLLDELYKKGYRHLALETLNYKDTAALKTRKYPVYESGFYQREPLYGELIRQALRKGFTLLAYESEVECSFITGKDDDYCNRFRDSIQAVNLATWVQKNPRKKLVVYAGYDHIHEQANGGWKHMAQFFQEMTGIDPYTIDQVQMNEKLGRNLEDPRYKALTAFKNIQTPVVAHEDDSLWSHSQKVDVTVFHPRYMNKMGTLPRFEDKSNRQGFYLLNNKRRPLLISRAPSEARGSELLPEGTSMIMAYYQNETGNRVPADVVELKKDQQETILFLYPGAYEVVYLNQQGTPFITRKIAIK